MQPAALSIQRWPRVFDPRTKSQSACYQTAASIFHSGEALTPLPFWEVGAMVSFRSHPLNPFRPTAEGSDDPETFEKPRWEPLWRMMPA